jgi:molybdate transport system substrate-binding protein
VQFADAEWNDLAQMGAMGMRFCAAAFASFIISSVPQAAELNVVSQANVKEALTLIIAQFEKETSDKINVAFGNPGVTLQRLRNGEPVDVVILSTTIIETVMKDGLADAASAVEIAKGSIGFCVKPTSVAPTVTDKASLITFLRSVSSIALVDPAAGGGTAMPLIDAIRSLKLDAEISPKYRMYKGAGEATVHAVEAGKAEACFTAKSEIIPYKGVKFSGQLPAEVSSWTSVTFAMKGHAARHPEIALKFIAFLQSDFSRAALRESGLE